MQSNHFLFDTNVFNHIFGFDNERQSAVVRQIKDSGLIVCTIPQILGELAATYKTDVGKGVGLCQLYAHLIHDDGLLYQPPELILIEVGTALNFSSNLQVLVEERGKQFGLALTDLANGHCSEETHSFIQTAMTQKKEHRNHCRDSKKLEDNQAVRGREVPFETIWQQEIQAGRLAGGLERYLRTMTDKGCFPSDLDVIAASKFLAKHIDKLPHLKAASRITPVLSYRYFFEDKKAKLGDLEDSANIIAVATLEGFVSDDVGAREMASLIFDDKLVLSLEEFLSKFGTT